MNEPVLVSVADGIATVTLNRPERKNAWTVQMQAHYFSALDHLTADDSVRVIVLTGAGGAFCPGADVDALSTYSDTGTTNPAATLIEQPEWFPVTVPKPIVAAIEGICAGVGLAQALMCDIRVVAPDTRLSTAFARRALPPMHGTARLLERVTGAAVATDLLLTGRTFTGDEAARLGVATEVAAVPLERALKLAHEMAAACAPSSMSRMKHQLWEPHLPGLVAAIESAETVLDDVLSSADFREGVTSFLERRAPKFSPLSPPANR